MTTIKICHEGDIRRISLPVENQYEHLEKEVHRIYPGKFPNGVQVRYIDDEDDHVTVTSNMELLEALNMSEATLKLFISPRSGDATESEFVKVSKDGQRTGVLNDADGYVKLEDSKEEETAKAKKEAEAKAKKEAEAKAKKEAEAKAKKEAEAKAKKEAEAKAKKKAEAKAKKEAEAKAKKEVEAKKRAEEKAKKAVEKAKKEAAAKKKAEEQAKKAVEKAKKEAAAKKKAEEQAKKAAEKAKKAAEKAKKAAEKAEKAAKKAFHNKLNLKFIKDVTIPDDMEVTFDQKLVKTWLVKNSGKVEWKDVILIRKKGGKSVPIDFKVPPIKPNEEIEISVDVRAPSRKGTHQIKYSLQHDGKQFGDTFWIQVKSRPERKADKKRAYDYKASPKTPLAPSPKNLPAPIKKPILGAQFVKDLNFPDDVLVAPGQKIVKSWLIKNTGECPWPKGTKLVSLDKDSTFGREASTEIKTLVKKGEQCTLTVSLTVPMKTGKSSAQFRLLSPDGDFFGHKYWINVQVTKFPSKEQLKALCFDFLGDPSVVKALQDEFPMIIKEIRQGKKLASIVDAILLKKPELKEHQFVVFLQPFLQSAERFMGLQLDTLVQMYSFWAMTPFSNGASIMPEAKNDQNDQKKVNDKEDNKTAEGARKPVQKSYAAMLKKDAPFKFAKELQQFADMGFKNLDAVKPLLMKHNGNVQNVMGELFSAGK